MGYVSTNYLAVIVAALASMALGALWYSSALFGKQWMALVGLAPEKTPELQYAKKSAGKGYALGYLTAVVTAYVLAYIISVAGAKSAIGGMQIGVWCWLGFVATFSYGQVVWEGKPLKLWLLNNAFNILSLALMGAIIGAWA